MLGSLRALNLIMSQPNAPQPQNQQQLQIDLPPTLEAAYANFALIQHSPSEFIIDFARILPGMPAAKVGARGDDAHAHQTSFARLAGKY